MRALYLTCRLPVFSHPHKASECSESILLKSTRKFSVHAIARGTYSYMIHVFMCLGLARTMCIRCIYRTSMDPPPHRKKQIFYGATAQPPPLKTILFSSFVLQPPPPPHCPTPKTECTPLELPHGCRRGWGCRFRECWEDS